MIFVDTSAWFAIVVPSDPNHQAAVRWLTGNPHPLLTTDYVIDESLTLLRSRGQPQRALSLGTEFFRLAWAAIHYLSIADNEAAWRVFHRYSDKAWSFTDCTSKVVIDRLGISTAFSFDYHFRQFGSVRVVP